jgi:hypothetical protein
MMMVDDDINNWSDDSSDESWTPSIDGEEELSDDEGIDWRETPFHPGDVYVTFDKTDSAIRLVWPSLHPCSWFFFSADISVSELTEKDFSSDERAVSEVDHDIQYFFQL